MGGGIYVDINLPNATTWFYLAFILAGALFLRFDRWWHLRNVDLVLLFLLVPPLLYLREGYETRRQAAAWLHQHGAELHIVEAALPLAAHWPLGGPAGVALTLGCADPAGLTSRHAAEAVLGPKSVWRAYLWLLIGTLVLWVRCLIDLALPRRAAFEPNLTAGGLVWLGVALFLIMSVRSLLPTSELVPASASPNFVLHRLAALLAAAWSPSSDIAMALATTRTALALTCHGLTVAGLFWIGWRHFQAPVVGLAAGVLYLLVPYTAYHLTDLTHAVPACLLTLAVVAYRWVWLAGVWMGLATALCYFPAFLWPLWIGFYWGRGARRFLAAAGLPLLVLGVWLTLDYDLLHALRNALGRGEWQPWDVATKPTSESLWTGVALHYAYRLPLFVAYLVVLGVTAFWPRPKHLAHLIALSAMLVIGIQFWYADGGGIYVQWYLPLLILMILRPTLTDRQPSAPIPLLSWLNQLGRWFRHALRRRPKRRVTLVTPPALRHVVASTPNQRLA